MTSTLARPNGLLTLPGEVTTTGLALPEGLTYDEWERVGQTIEHIEGSIHWWRGDWLRYGERTYGEMYAQALDPESGKYSTLQNEVWVAGKIEMFRRLNILSWSHHQTVAALEPEHQDAFLKRAANEGWSHKELRQQVKAWKATQKIKPTPKTPPAPRVLIPEPAREAILERAEAGETYESIAQDFLVSDERIGDIVREEKAEQERLKETLEAIPPPAAQAVPPRLVRDMAEDWLPAQDGCDLLLTDPPYSTDVSDIRTFASAWLPVALARVKPTGRAYVCIGAYPEELAAYLSVDPGHLILAGVLVWTYRNTLGPQPKHDYKLNWQAVLYYRGAEAPPLDCAQMTEQFSVQDLNAPDGRQGDRWHTWQKPDELAERFVRHSTRKGDLVLDPFAGTGTFLLAAARLGRVALGCDSDPEMLRIAKERGCDVADA